MCTLSLLSNTTTGHSFSCIPYDYYFYFVISEIFDFSCKYFTKFLVRMRVWVYPGNFIDVCIKRYLNQVFINKKIYALAPKKELVTCYHSLGKNHYN